MDILGTLSDTLSAVLLGSIKVEKFQVQKNEQDPAYSLDCLWERVESATGYKIRYKCPDKTCVVSVPADSCEHTIKDLLPNTEYSVTIKAKEESGFGVYINEEKEFTGLSKPKDGTLEVENQNNVIVKFVEAPSATSHKIVLSDSAGNESTEITRLGAQKAKFSNLEYNMEYRATITSYYDKEEGGQIKTNTVLTAPAAPRKDNIQWEPDKNNLSSAFTISIEPEDNCTEYRARIRCFDIKDENDYGHQWMMMEMNTGDDNRARLRYNCYYHGFVYGVMLQAKNPGGYSEWSDQKIIITAPKKINELQIDFEEDADKKNVYKVYAQWKKVKHTRTYVLRLFEVGRNQPLEERRISNRSHTFQTQVQHGIKYFCEVFANNDTGNGPTTISNTILIPLDPPESLAVIDKREHAKLTWVPSVGMESAFIKFRNSDLETTEHTVYGVEWLSPPMTDGEVYGFEVWACSGGSRSKGYLRETLVTEPSDIIVIRDKTRPETCLNVEIISKHRGPFLLTWRETRSTHDKMKEGKVGHSFTIEDLKPATDYSVAAACLYRENRKSSSRVADPIMTLPAKVTGVKCDHKYSPSIKLAWDSCRHELVKYTVTWSRNHLFFKEVTTYDTFWDFENLSPGSYHFYVSAGGGKRSDPHFVRVLEVPSIESMVVSKKHIQLICSMVLHADEYVLRLTPINDEKQEDYKAENREDDKNENLEDDKEENQEDGGDENQEDDEGENQVDDKNKNLEDDKEENLEDDKDENQEDDKGENKDDNKWPKVFHSPDAKFWIDCNFERGVKYLATVHSSWNDYLSAGVKKHFYADLPPPYGVKYRLDKNHPTSKVHFKWETPGQVKQTYLQLVYADDQVLTEATVNENEWDCGSLQANQKYELKLYSGDGVKFYKSHATLKFRTAPDQPREVGVKLNPSDPTTKMDLMITSDYEGPFEVLTIDSRDNEEITDSDSKSVTIHNLRPREDYRFYVRSKFTDEANGDVFRSEFTPAIRMK